MNGNGRVPQFKASSFLLLDAANEYTYMHSFLLIKQLDPAKQAGCR
jgi:hypothetical protein